jgi:transcriptional regulator with XRE-family HTH domain
MAQMIGPEIEKLRNKMGLNQAEFGRLLGLTAMVVCRWERGVNRVPSRTLLALGLLKREAGMDGWSFWELAGLTRKDAQAMLGRPLRNPPASLSKRRPESH